MANRIITVAGIQTTYGHDLKDNIAKELKEQRLALLQARVKQMDQAFKEGLLGSVQQVLVERPARKGVGQVAGRTSSNRWVNFDGDVSLIGKMVAVKITEVQPNSLRGQLVAGIAHA